MARSRKQKPAPVPLGAAGASALIDKAVALHRAGEIDLARKAYLDVLAAIPRHPDALHLLGIIAFQRDENAEALDLVNRAISANGSTPSFHSTRGNVLQTMGRLDEAVKSFDKAIALKPDYAVAYSNRGAALRKLGRIEEALASADKAIALDPNLAEAHSNRGAALEELERYPEALKSFDQAIALRAGVADAHFGRANVLVKSSRPDQAIEAYGQVLAINPQFPDALINRAFVFESLQRFGEALQDVEAFLALQPDFVDALILRVTCLNGLSRHAEAFAFSGKIVAPDRPDLHLQRGLSLHGLGRLSEALAEFKSAIALDGRFVEALFAEMVALDQLGRAHDALAVCQRLNAVNPMLPEPYIRQGQILEAQGRPHEAHTAFRQASALVPQNSDVLSGLVSTAVKVGRLDEALEAANRLVEALPQRADAHNLLGTVLQRLERFDDAVASYRRAVEIDDNLSGAHANLGGALVELCRLDEASASLVRALRLDSENMSARWNLCLALLLSGDLSRGWELYDARFSKSHQPVPQLKIDQPLWRGSESLVGKTILVRSEQGLGDTIQFVRYVPLLAAKGARVLVDAAPSLVSVLAGIDGADQVIATGQPVPYFDLQCPLPSLPQAFGTDLSSIPATQAYLFSDPEKKKQWADRLGARDKPRVGLVWSGSTIHENDHNRSLPLARLLPFLPKGVDYVALQKDLRPADAAALASNPAIRFLGDEIVDFSDTAALCDLVDVVISVDTSVAHLAGALGRPTWLLLPFCPDWRWMLGRSDSPWYPSMRLYRQASHGDWEGVLARLQQDVEALKKG